MLLLTASFTGTCRVCKQGSSQAASAVHCAVFITIKMGQIYYSYYFSIKNLSPFMQSLIPGFDAVHYIRDTGHTPGIQYGELLFLFTGE
jgi:hypothetical protein